MHHKILLLIGLSIFGFIDPSFSQEIKIPEDYQNFLDAHDQKSFDLFFRIDTWTFWDKKKLGEKSLEFTNKGWIKSGDVPIAINADEQILYYPAKFQQDHHIYLVDADLEPMFYAMGTCQFELFEKTKSFIKGIENEGYKKQDLAPIANCPGSMFAYAFALNTSEYDDNFSEERNIQARLMFEKLALEGHPEAANEMGDYHYFQAEVDTEKLIYWREKAIELGSEEDAYELADFIIDEAPDQIEKAISALKSLFNSKRYRERAQLKLARLYMRGSGGKKDYAKGLELSQKLAEEGNHNAMADLAFYQYRAMGMEKDVKKALDLLRKAEALSIKETGRGNWGDFIKDLEQELGETN